jgi:muramoyltetrapeptide carboxypeptidase
MQQAGVFAKIAGLAVGRLHRQSGVTGDDLRRILSETLDGFCWPVATGLDFGHTDPMITLPIGLGTRLTCDERAFLDVSDATVSATIV